MRNTEICKKTGIIPNRIRLFSGGILLLGLVILYPHKEIHAQNNPPATVPADRKNTTVPKTNTPVQVNQKPGTNVPVVPKAGTNVPVVAKPVTNVPVVPKAGTNVPVTPAGAPKKGDVKDTTARPALKLNDTPDETEETGDTSEDSLSEMEFVFRGFVEFENFFNTYSEQDFKSANKKNEFRGNADMKYGTDRIYGRMVVNGYIMPAYPSSMYADYRYEQKFNVALNGRISDTFYELSFNELFINYSTPYLRLRLGNQIYSWGTADINNPTSYINPTDTRELFFKDESENRVGVPSLSGLVFIKDYTLELVFIPFHVPAIMPEMENFWGYHYRLGPIALFQDKTRTLPIAPENFGYAARFAGSIMGVDASLSGYHGPDRGPLLRPMKSLNPANDFGVLIRPEYYTVSYTGFDFSFKWWKLVFQGEGAFSPDKASVVNQDLSTSLDDYTFPFDIKRYMWASYSVGCNYFQDSLVVTVEWNQSRYITSEVMESYLSDILTFNVSDSFFDEKLELSLTWVNDVKQKGFLLLPRVTYTLPYELKLTVMYAYIDAYVENNDKSQINVFTLFNDKDILIVSLRYVF